MKGKKVLVVGYGVSGQAAFDFLQAKGADVWVVDDNPEKIWGLERPFPERFDLCVVSPGIPKTHRFYLQDVEVIGEMELACRGLQNRCVGITGTNGKTTVSEMVAHVLRLAGFSVHLLGNGGVPVTREIEKIQPDDIVVLELSSFQLETLSSKVLDAAAILNITEDHLDRYSDFAAYRDAKLRIAACVKPTGNFFIHPSLAPFVESDYRTFESASDHNEENANAAFSLCQTFGVSKETFVEALQSFQKPPHRLEFVKMVQGVSFYDDSKGTNVDAVIRAVSTLKGNVFLIAGGVDKGSDFTAWASPFKGKVAHLFLIGSAAEKIRRQLSSYVSVDQCCSLKDAVVCALEIAKPGDHVLLSPGCASFDMFRSYADRGDQFKEIVRMLDHEST